MQSKNNQNPSSESKHFLSEFYVSSQNDITHPLFSLPAPAPTPKISVFLSEILIFHAEIIREREKEDGVGPGG